MGMLRKVNRWCPNGCGKKVKIVTRYPEVPKTIYKCSKCYRIFTLKQLRKFMGSKLAGG